MVSSKNDHCVFMFKKFKKRGTHENRSETKKVRTLSSASSPLISTEYNDTTSAEARTYASATTKPAASKNIVVYFS